MATYKRILLKLSGESLMGESNTALMKNVLPNMRHRLRKFMNWAYKSVSSSAAETFSAG